MRAEPDYRSACRDRNHVIKGIIYTEARAPDQLAYAFALRHASAYNLIVADHPSLVAETFCFAPHAKLLSVTVVPSFRPRLPFSLPR
jgi:hypothetical protein